ncbi:hypothetical protein KCU85_g10013, partial [Aureobasidium melanogenum]
MMVGLTGQLPYALQPAAVAMPSTSAGESVETTTAAQPASTPSSGAPANTAISKTSSSTAATGSSSKSPAGGPAASSAVLPQSSVRAQQGDSNSQSPAHGSGNGQADPAQSTSASNALQVFSQAESSAQVHATALPGGSSDPKVSTGSSSYQGSSSNPSSGSNSGSSSGSGSLQSPGSSSSGGSAASSGSSDPSPGSPDPSGQSSGSSSSSSSGNGSGESSGSSSQSFGNRAGSESSGQPSGPSSKSSGSSGSSSSGSEGNGSDAGSRPSGSSGGAGSSGSSGRSGQAGSSPSGNSGSAEGAAQGQETSDPASTVVSLDRTCSDSCGLLPSPHTPQFPTFDNLISRHAPKLLYLLRHLSFGGIDDHSVPSLCPRTPEVFNVMPHSMPTTTNHPLVYGTSNSSTPEPLRQPITLDATTKPESRKHLYPCPLAKAFDCSHFFTTSGHAARHAKKHIGKRDAFCSECNKAFTRRDNMEQHRRTHQNVRGSAEAAPESSKVRRSTIPLSCQSDKPLPPSLEAAALAQVEQQDQQQARQQRRQHVAQRSMMSQGPLFIDPDPGQALSQPIPIDLPSQSRLYHSGYTNQLDSIPAMALVMPNRRDLRAYNYPPLGFSNGLDTLALAPSDHRRFPGEDPC